MLPGVLALACACLVYLAATRPSTIAWLFHLHRHSELVSAVSIENGQWARAGKPIPWWLARLYLTADHRPQIVILGSSQLGGMRAADATVAGRRLDYTLDCRGYALEHALRVRNPQLTRPGEVFVAAMPGAIVSDYCALARAVLSERHRTDLAVMAVSLRDFMSNGSAFGASQTFRFFAPFASLDQRLIGLAYPRPLDRLFLPLTSGVQARAARSSPHQVRPGDFVFLPEDPQTYKDIDFPYPAGLSIENNPWLDHQLSILAATVELLSGRGIRTLIVDMPVQEKNRRQLGQPTWQRYHDKLERNCRLCGAGYLDLGACDDFVREDFLDTIHLSWRGGAKLAEKMADYLATHQRP